MKGRRVVVFYCRQIVTKPAISLYFLTIAYFGFYNTWSVIEKQTLPDVINIPFTEAINSTKTILIWDIRNHIDFQVLMDKARMKRCPVSDCLLTQERTLAALHDADAVIFNAPPLKIEDFPVDPHRRPEQRYVFLSPEPPILFADNVEKFNHIFNWTMSYKRDSDIPYLYGDIEPRTTTTANSLTVNAITKSKTKLVAWFVSHCFTQSRREAYVEQLAKHIDMDVYGDCNKQMLQCTQNSTTHLSDDSCYEMLERDYKFYLAFENSLCVDYVTEKFFQILQRRVIPVVLGHADYSKIAPPNSYIDARRFSPRGLATYLKRLAANDTLYNNFFQWKDRYLVKTRYPDMAERALCHLCEKLHSEGSPSVYDNLGSHWSGKSQCIRPRYKNLPLVFGVF